MTDELKPCLAYPCDGHMKENNYDASLECSSCQFIVADESEYNALVAGEQAAIDAALIDLTHDLGSLYIHRNGHELYNSAIDDVARFIKGQLGTNPLAKRDARIAELERELAEARKDAERYEAKLFALGAMEEPPCFKCGYNGPGYFQTATHPCAHNHHNAMRQEGE